MEGSLSSKKENALGTTDFECKAGLPSAFWKQTKLSTRNLLCSVAICLGSRTCFKHSPVCFILAPMYVQLGTGQRYLSSGSVSELVGEMKHNERSRPSSCFSPHDLGCIKGIPATVSTEPAVEVSEDRLARAMNRLCERQAPCVRLLCEGESSRSSSAREGPAQSALTQNAYGAGGWWTPWCVAGPLSMTHVPTSFTNKEEPRERENPVLPQQP